VAPFEWHQLISLGTDQTGSEFLSQVASALNLLRQKLFLAQGQTSSNDKVWLRLGCEVISDHRSFQARALTGCHLWLILGDSEKDDFGQRGADLI